jgi:GxxExxY protein
VTTTLAVHRAQLLTCLRLTGKPAGLLINFNVPILKNGIKRVLNAKDDLRASPRTPRLRV